MKEQKRYTIGIDIGGSHISSAAIDVATFEILPGSGYSSKINHRLKKDEILSQWAAVINKSLTHLSGEICLGVGFAMPGPFNYPSGVAKFEGNDKYENLYDVPVREHLQKLLSRPQLELHFYNDASCFGVGALKSLGSKAKRAVGLTLGTGFGSVFLEGGTPILEGPDIPKNGSLWGLPFKESIADDYFGTRWFLKEFETRTGEQVQGVKEMIETPHEVIQDIFNDYAENLGDFILQYLLEFKPEELLLGGNIAKSHPYFLPKLTAFLDEHHLSLPVHILTETERCNILGACQLMLLNYWGDRESLDSFF